MFMSVDPVWMAPYHTEDQPAWTGDRVDAHGKHHVWGTSPFRLRNAVALPLTRHLLLRTIVYDPRETDHLPLTKMQWSGSIGSQLVS